MQLVIGLLLVLALIIGGIWAASAYQSSHARVLEAQLALGAQHNANQANTAVIFVLMLVIGVMLMGIGLYLYWRAQRAYRRWQRRMGQLNRPTNQQRRWLSGPNAYWQAGYGQLPQQPEYPYGQPATYRQVPQAPYPSYRLPAYPQPQTYGAIVPTGYFEDDAWYFEGFDDEEVF